MSEVNRKIGLIVVSSVVAITLLLAVGLFYNNRSPVRRKATPQAQQISLAQRLSSAPSAGRSLDEFIALERELDTVFRHNALFLDTWSPRRNRQALGASLREEADQLIFSIDIPGVDPKRIDVSVQNNLLSIHLQNTDKQSSSALYYQFVVPSAADSDKITAQASRGVLEIIIPKSENTPARKITVQEK